MLTSKHLSEEIKRLDEACEAGAGSVGLDKVVKGLTLILKLMKDIRTNQVLLLKKQGVELVRSVREKKEEK